MRIARAMQCQSERRESCGVGVDTATVCQAQKTAETTEREKSYAELCNVAWLKLGSFGRVVTRDCGQVSYLFRTLGADHWQQNNLLELRLHPLGMTNTVLVTSKWRPLVQDGRHLNI